MGAPRCAILDCKIRPGTKILRNDVQRSRIPKSDLFFKEVNCSVHSSHQLLCYGALVRADLAKLKWSYRLPQHWPDQNLFQYILYIHIRIYRMENDESKLHSFLRKLLFLSQNQSIYRACACTANASGDLAMWERERLRENIETERLSTSQCLLRHPTSKLYSFHCDIRTPWCCRRVSGQNSIQSGRSALTNLSPHPSIDSLS